MLSAMKLPSWLRPQPKFAPKFGQQLFVHIGCHRTGTTSIQNYLRTNAALLAKRGYYLPFGRGRQSAFVSRLFDGELSVEEFAEQLHAGALEHVGAAAKIVLSDEDISQKTNLELLQGLRHFFDVKIIFSMRRQDIWLESWYFQNVKWQWNPALSHLTWDAFLGVREQFHWIDYAAHLGRLEALFGRENLLLSVFEKRQMPEGPVVGFCHQLGLTDLDGFSTPPHVNSSLSAEMTEFLRHLPLDAVETSARAVFRNALDRVDRSVLGHTAKQSERLMSPEARSHVLEQYAAGNRRVAKRYFGRQDLFLDPLPKPETPLATLDIPSESEAVVARYVGPMLMQLVQDEKLVLPETSTKR